MAMYSIIIDYSFYPVFTKQLIQSATEDQTCLKLIIGENFITARLEC